MSAIAQAKESGCVDNDFLIPSRNERFDQNGGILYWDKSFQGFFRYACLKIKKI
jgi:hypothetical protein